MSRISLLLTVVGSIFLASVGGVKFEAGSGCPKLETAYELKGYKSGYCMTPDRYNTDNNNYLLLWYCGQSRAESQYKLRNMHWRDEDNLDINDLFGWYAIVESKTGKCLTLNKDGGHTTNRDDKVYLYDCAPENGKENPHQMWAFFASYWGSSYGYNIMNHASPRCLAVYAGSTSTGAVMTVDECHADWYNQLWSFNGC